MAMAMAMAMAMGTSSLSSCATTPGRFCFPLSRESSCKRRSEGRGHAVSMMPAPPDAALMLQSVSEQDHHFVTWQVIAGAAGGLLFCSTTLLSRSSLYKWTHLVYLCVIGFNIIKQSPSVDGTFLKLQNFNA